MTATPTAAEGALSALFAALGVTIPAGAKLLRNVILPERVPPKGVAILRDGDPGEPEVLLSPPRYIYEHRAEIDIAVEAATRTSISLRSTTTCRCRIGVTAASISTLWRVGRRYTTSPICNRTSRAARASTGSTPTAPTATRRFAPPSPTAAPGSLGSSATRI